MDTLTDNIVRTACPDSVRADSDGDGRTLYGHFSVFNAWYEVNSVYEGRFLERTAAGAFEESFATRGSQIKAQYEHGKDPFVGSSVLGPFEELREDDTGGYYRIGLIDTDYNRDRIIPQARAGLLGASFRFSVPESGDDWVDHPGRSDHNPLGLPERTITRANVYELGPVVFGASGAATAVLRSDTDSFFDALLSDPRFVARFTERAGLKVVENILSSLPPDGRSSSTPRASADGQGEGIGTRDPRACLAIVETLRLAQA